MRVESVGYTDVGAINLNVRVQKLAAGFIDSHLLDDLLAKRLAKLVTLIQNQRLLGCAPVCEVLAVCGDPLRMQCRQII